MQIGDKVRVVGYGSLLNMTKEGELVRVTKTRVRLKFHSPLLGWEYEYNYNLLNGRCVGDAREMSGWKLHPEDWTRLQQIPYKGGK